MLLGSRQRIATLTQGLDLSINEISLKKVGSSKSLGVEIDEFLTWDTHVTCVSKKVSSGIGVMKKIKPFVPVSNLTTVYQSIVEPYFDYCSIVWDRSLIPTICPSQQENLYLETTYSFRSCSFRNSIPG